MSAKAEEEHEKPMSKEEKVQIERQQEEKLRAKYPAPRAPFNPHAAAAAGNSAGNAVVGHGAGGGGHSAFLQKRLAKGQKYFDSGDYQMAKQRPRGAANRPLLGAGAAANAAAANAAANTANAPAALQPMMPPPPPVTGETIPTPELVPARKTSIIQPLHDHSQVTSTEWGEIR